MSAGAYRELGNFDKAYDLLKESYTSMATLNWGEDNIGCATILNSMGLLFKRWRKFDWALDCYKRSLDIWLNLLGDAHPEVIATWHNIGELYIEMGNTAEAEVYLTANLKYLKHEH